MKRVCITSGIVFCCLGLCLSAAQAYTTLWVTPGERACPNPEYHNRMIDQFNETPGKENETRVITSGVMATSLVDRSCIHKSMADHVTQQVNFMLKSAVKQQQPCIEL